MDKDSYMKNCRWCHHFRNGKCWNEDRLKSASDLGIYEVAESGHLEELFKEEIGSADLTNFKKELKSKLLEWGVSKKRVNEFDYLFDESFREFSQDLVSKVDGEVSKLYQEGLDKSFFEGFEIKDPEDFVCKDWY